MPQLPSGRYVDIMAERARYHARRLRLRITDSTPHQQLYPLIDILVDPTHNHHGCRSCTTFSGHTLADRNWINQWQECDRRFFLAWLREESQVRHIEQARARLLAERTTPREKLHDYPQRLYSQLHHRILTLGMQRAPATQWLRTLLNMRNDGIRREELDWSGVTQFLSTQPAERVLELNEVMAAIDFRRITPQLSNDLECNTQGKLPFAEVAQRLRGYQLQMAGYSVEEGDVGVVRYRCDAPDYRVGMIRRGGRTLPSASGSNWFVLGPYARAVGDANGKLLFVTCEEARDAADAHARQHHRLRSTFTYSTTYEYMSLYGGEEYREWLVTLPDYHCSHFTAHYHERNVLLHIRTKVRTSACGKKVLFIEELQSDWQQAVARHGLRSGIPLAPFRKEWPSLALKLMLLHAVDSGLEGIAWADAAVHEMRYDRAMAPLQRLYNKALPQTLNRIARPWGGKVRTTQFHTLRPWLHAARCNECWRVEGGEGKFSTRPRYDKQQAMALIERHSKALTLELPVLWLPEAMKRHIAAQGLPLFGESINLNP